MYFPEEIGASESRSVVRIMFAALSQPGQLLQLHFLAQRSTAVDDQRKPRGEIALQFDNEISFKVQRAHDFASLAAARDLSQNDNKITAMRKQKTSLSADERRRQIESTACVFRK